MEETNQALIQKIHEKIDLILKTDFVEEQKVSILRDALLIIEDKRRGEVLKWNE